MPIPSVMSDLSTTAASNYPTGSESPTTGDDYIRAYAAILRATNAKGADIASATTTDIGAATGEFVDVTGTTTITGLGTIASGIRRVVRFTGALTLTYNATSLILPGSSNITTANGDIAMFRSLGSGNWVCTSYMRRDGTAIGGAPFIDSTALVKGSGDATKLLRVEADGITTATTRVWTAQDKDITVAGLVDINGGSQLGSKIQPISASVAANALTITLNPTVLDFRSSTLTSGTVNTRTVSAAISVVVSSGSTLGTTNAVQSRLVVIAIDNAGTVELAVVNPSSGLDLTEVGLISTTAEGGAGAADSANVIYSTTARSNVSYRVVGYVESTQATAGTWATAPSTIQGAGGQSAISTALNAQGAAPMFACRAWVNFNGTGTVAIRGSGNVSSITDNGVGDYTVNFTTAMPDVNYEVSGSGSVDATSPAVVSPTSTATYLTTSVRVGVFNNGGTAVDRAVVSVNVIR